MKKKWIFIAILLLLLLIALLQFDGRKILDSINQVPWWLMLLLFGLQIVTQLLVNLQWHRVAKIADVTISFWDMFYVNCQGAVIDCITPGVKVGGEVTRAIQISRIASCSSAQSKTIVALQKLFSISALFFILLFSIGYLIGEVLWLSSRFVQILIYGLLMLILLLFCSILFFSSKVKSHLKRNNASRYLWIRKINNFLFIFLESLVNVRKNPKTLIMLTVMSLLIWLLYPIKMYILLFQFYPEAHIIHISAITFAAYLVALLPIFPGGIGGFEGALSGLLVGTGIAISDAAVITIFFRFVTFWFVMLFSFVLIAMRNIRKINRPPRKPIAPSP